LKLSFKPGLKLNLVLNLDSQSKSFDLV